MTSQQKTFSVFSTEDYGDLKKAKQDWSKRLITNNAVVVSAFSAKSQSKVVSHKPNTNVVGVGIGEQTTNGVPSGILAVKFFVRKKYSKKELSKGDLLPETISGLPVDVEETGSFRAQTMPNPRRRMRPARPGSSVGFEIPDSTFVVAGTFGALVVKNSKLYILSNNHVLADEGRLPIGSPIFQPGLLDGGNTNTDAIARLSQFVPFATSGNEVDVAIAEVIRRSDVNKAILHIETLLAGSPVGTKKAANDMVVHKFGRTTGYTVGRVTGIETDVMVDYDSGSFTFSDQILIVGRNNTSFSDAGDSGSLIVERSSGKAVGLLFAGTETHTVANHIGKVLSALKVKLA
ncbi:MAG TPA: hypothetical protein VGO50_11585 [Pyrinomonadaceae bacterium]|jgi:hypothetical protein|nr:hypothetical protein [Pyrinomonadaceae bacterium]